MLIRKRSGLPVLLLSSATAISMRDARLARKGALRARRRMSAIESIAGGVSSGLAGAIGLTPYAGRSSGALQADAVAWSLSVVRSASQDPPSVAPEDGSLDYRLGCRLHPGSHQIELEMARLAMLSSSAPFN